MKNPMLKYTVVSKFDKAILFTILEQSPKLKKFLDKRSNKVWKAPNGWRVTYDRVASVNVKNKVVFLRGSQTESDNRVDRTMGIANNSLRDRYVNEVNSALADFVKAVKADKSGSKGFCLPFGRGSFIVFAAAEASEESDSSTIFRL